MLKILVSHADLTGLALIDRVRSFVPHGIEVASSGAPFVEITGAGVNKALGVSMLAGALGIAAADGVTGHHHDDGVAQAVERLLDA